MAKILSTQKYVALYTYVVKNKRIERQEQIAENSRYTY